MSAMTKDEWIEWADAEISRLNSQLARSMKVVEAARAVFSGRWQGPHYTGVNANDICVLGDQLAEFDSPSEPVVSQEEPK